MASVVDSGNYSTDVVSSPTRVTYVDAELEVKAKKASEKISENMHIFANDPSLACYRLQEHIQKSLPQLVLKRLEVSQLQRELQGKCYDLEYSVNAVKSMQRSQNTFRSTRELLQKAINLKQQLSRIEGKHGEKKKKKSTNSMYQRFSGSFDLPSSLLPSGLSSSASASADLKSSTVSQQHRPSQGGRRTRASSVSSPSSHPTVARAHSASCSPTLRKTAGVGSPSSLARGQSIS